MCSLAQKGTYNLARRVRLHSSSEGCTVAHLGEKLDPDPDLNQHLSQNSEALEAQSIAVEGSER